jgi:cyclase
MTLDRGEAVKTTQFLDPSYVGDPVNIISIFNNKLVDEMVILDISRDPTHLDIGLLREISEESFFPISYGGNISSCNDLDLVVATGYEKIVLGSAAYNLQVLEYAIETLGSSGVAVIMDSRPLTGEINQFFVKTGTKLGIVPLKQRVEYLEDRGIGEFIFQDIDADGMRAGINQQFAHFVSDITTVPNTYLGGVSSVDDIDFLFGLGFSGVAASSLFTYVGDRRAVLLSYLSEVDYPREAV